MQFTAEPDGIGWVISVVALIGMVCLWAWRRRRAGRAEGPTCGRCGYDVRGLPSAICPECGSDLTVVGVMEAGSVARAGVGVKVLYWTLAMVMLSPAVVWVGMEYGPAVRYEQASYEMVPKSGRTQGCTCRTGGRDWGWWRRWVR